MMQHLSGSARRAFSALVKAAAIIMIAAASLILSLPVQAAESWQPNDDDALFFDLRSGKYRLGDGIRGYQTDSDVCVNLADIIIAMDMPLRLDRKSRRATGWIFSERQTLTIDRDSGIVQIVNMSRKLAENEIRDTPDGWCVSTKSLASWFDIKLTPDLSNALLIIESETKLPFESALERKERAAKIRPQRSFDLANLPQANEPYRLWRTPSVDAVISAGGLVDRTSGQHVDAQYELYASGELAKASFDARLSSNRRAVPQSLRLRAYRSDPQGRLLGPLGATHFAIGDIATVSTPLVSQNSAGRGAFVTNRPLNRPDSFDRTSFRGELPSGWEAELYRNGQLLAFAETRTDGRYEFIDVPLFYGQNSFEVILYGPQGQVRRETQAIPVGNESIPPQQSYYWAGATDAGKELIQFGSTFASQVGGWRGGFGYERGLDARTSVSASLFSLQIADIRHQYAEGSLRRSVGSTLIELSASSNFDGGTALRGQLLGQIGKGSITAESIWARGNFVSDRIQRNDRSQHRLSLDHQLKLGQQLVPFHIDAEYESSDTGIDTLDMTARSSINLRRLSFTGELNWEKQYRSSGTDPPDRVNARLLANGRLGKVRLRGEANYQISPESRLEQVNFTGEWNAGERAEWRAQLGYDVDQNRARAEIGIVRQFDRFSINASAEAASDGSLAAGLNLAFSFGPDPRSGKFRVANDKLATNGQALAIVYRDKNRDGKRQPDELLVENVELTAGSRAGSEPTDINGQAMVDNLAPFQQIMIGIDSSSLPDPYTQLAIPGVVITPRPGVSVTVELPLVSAGEVEGTLIRQGGGPLSGVGLELIDAKGNVIRETHTEFDGFFLFEGVPFGSYGLQIAKLSAQATKLSPQLTAQVVVDDDNQIARLGNIFATGNAVMAEAIAAKPPPVTTPTM